MAADDDERTEEPTQRRLDEARRKGDIVYTPEVGAAFSLIGVTIILATLAGPISNSIARSFVVFLQSPDQFSTDPMALRQLIASVAMHAGGAVAMAALALALAGIAARYVQDMPTFSGEKLSPDLNKLNPFEGAKRVFGPAAFANFTKSLIKFVVVGAALVSALWPHDNSLANLSLLDPAALPRFLNDKAVTLVASLATAATLLALADYVFTRQSYRKRLRMSRREIREEMRQSEGDPMVRMKLRQIRTERARRRMLANVPKATVVIANPTHFAVALRYEQGETAAPICLAKGVDEVALRIRAVAEENDVPVIEDPPLARALFAAADVDEPIPRAHYEAVAKVIGVVMRLAQQRRRGRRAPNRAL